MQNKRLNERILQTNVLTACLSCRRGMTVEDLSIQINSDIADLKRNPCQFGFCGPLYTQLLSVIFFSCFQFFK